MVYTPVYQLIPMLRDRTDTMSLWQNRQIILQFQNIIWRYFKCSLCKDPRITSSNVTLPVSAKVIPFRSLFGALEPQPRIQFHCFQFQRSFSFHRSAYFIPCIFLFTFPLVKKFPKENGRIQKRPKNKTGPWGGSKDTFFDIGIPWPIKS